MTKTKNFLEDIVDRTIKNLDIAVLAGGTALLFPTAATIATIVGGGYLLADSVIKHYEKRENQQIHQIRTLQQEVNNYLDRYKLELALKLHEYGFNYEQITNYLDQIIRKEDIAKYYMPNRNAA